MCIEKKWIRFLIGCVALTYFLPVYAVTFIPNGTPDVAQMLINLSNNIPGLTKLVTGFSYVAGFFLVVRGLLELKKLGEQRTMMSGEQSITGPLIYIFIGTVLIYIPSSVRIGLGTLWNGAVAPYAWQTSAIDSWSLLSSSIFGIVQLIGIISFIRGMLLLLQLGGHAQPGVFGKAMAHIIAGILCINLYAFLQLISNTFGIGQWY